MLNESMCTGSYSFCRMNVLIRYCPNQRCDSLGAPITEMLQLCPCLETEHDSYSLPHTAWERKEKLVGDINITASGI